jgi:2-C-methyl-D-erythritol 2,4-cyclodiphosphate synthase
MSYLIGQGFDTHQLANGYKLIIGGIEIPFAKGSKGHSDGDVLIHAMVDSLLGAISAGDIGTYFPSSDDQWKGADSRIFLEHAMKAIQDKGYEIKNIDSTIILQKPHINSYINQMRENLSEMMNISIDKVSVKATTTDYLGFTGRGEGIASSSIVLLQEKED